METPLAFGNPLEVLDDIGQVGAGAFDPDGGQRRIEHLPGWPDERSPGHVLAVSGLLTNQHHLGVRCPLAEDRLGARTPKVTRLTPAGRRAQPCQRGVGWDQFNCAPHG